MSELKEFVKEKAYLWPEGVCPAAIDEIEDRYCPLDGGVGFSSSIEGKPIVDKRCPECGSELKIKYKLKFSSTDLEDVPEEIREHVEKPEFKQTNAEGDASK